MEHSLFYVLCINIIGIFFGWLFTENSRWALTRIWSGFGRKPFNCRPCLTFHLLWIMYMVVAFMLKSLQFGLMGLILSFVVFLGLYFEGKSKIED